MTLARFAYAAAVVLALACVLVIVLLVLVRVLKDRSEQRRLKMRAPVWRTVMTLSSGEDEELEEAYARLLQTTAAERRAVLSDAFSLLPKLRGEARQRMREVLRAWNASSGSRNHTTSRSAVRRTRGYYRLGVLAQPGRVGLILAGLRDHDFIARRTAMLALGSFPTPDVVAAMLTAAVEEPRLRRDFLASIVRIGRPAVPVLREQLAASLDQDGTDARRGQLTAEALGLVGGIDDVVALEEVLGVAPRQMQIACINALGQLGSPTSVHVLSSAVLHDSPVVRRVAAQALGLVGGNSAVTPLSTALHDTSVEVARAAADALYRCGAGGKSVLDESTAPVAREVLALAALGSS